MSAPYLYTSTGVAAVPAGVVVTHSLSVTASNLFFIITPTAASTASCAFTKTTHDANTVTIAGLTTGCVVDVCAIQFHSIQGGPT